MSLRATLHRIARSPHALPRAALFGVTLWSLLGLWTFGWWENHDGISSPLRLAAFTHEIEQGHLWVRWASLLNGGHGSPLFIFYAPGLMYLATPFHLVGFHLLDSLKLATLALRFVGVFSMSALGARRFGPWGGLCAGLAFALTPYLNALVFVRGAFSEHAALCLIPPLLLSLDRAFSRRRSSHLLWSSLLFAAIICTHNITGLMVAPTLLLWGLLTAALSAKIRVAVKTGLVFGWGLALAALFWIPALALSPSVRIDEMFSDWQSWTYMCDLDRLWSGFREVGGQPTVRNISFAPGDWQTLAALGALLVCARDVGRARGRGSRGGVACRRLVSVAVPSAIFAVTAALFGWLDAPFWERVPLVTTMQFPYRLLVIMTPMICLAAAGLGRLFPRRMDHAWPLVLLLALVATSGSMYPGPQTKANMTVNGRERSVKSRRIEHRLLTTYQTANNHDEFLPRSVPRDSSAVGSVASSEPIIRPPESGQIDTYDPHRFRGEVSLTASAELRFPVYAFSGWRAEVDGEPATVRADPDGLITIDCPAGRHTVELRFGLDSSSRFGLAISVATLLAGLIFLGWCARPRGRRKASEASAS